MRRQFNNLISVGCSVIRVICLKIIRGSTFSSGLIQRISPDVVLEFNKGSRVSFGQRIRIHSGSKIKVRTQAKLTIGDNVKINYNCIIACHENISIGSGTEFGPSVYLYDHDHDYSKGLSANSDDECFKKDSIIIGEKCWIGAQTIILKGSTIGDHCVIAAGSIVSGNVPDHSVYIQKRQTMIKEY